MRLRFAVVLIPALAPIAVFLSCAQPNSLLPTRPRLTFTLLEDRVRVETNGQLFTEYWFKNVPKPYCHPLVGPRQSILTRLWPMQEFHGEDRDHPHHRGFWYAHGNVNGVDFWTEGPNRGRIVHQEFLEMRDQGDIVQWRARNHWIAPDGRILCTDERTLRFTTTVEDARFVDFDITLIASHGPVVFGDTKEGTLAVRVAESMRVRPNAAHAGSPRGTIVTSQGHRDGTAWGQRAAWCDYSGRVSGRAVGIAIFDHPENPRHPTWWHVRDYGLFAANPFGRHDFEQIADSSAGNLVIPAQERVTFRYRLYLHEGDATEAAVAEQYAAWIRSQGGR
ncbi:MAG: PmoA family protein [Verrucomicrobiota bacterium]|nr:PmoA family protein [Limisphaera sp.]MDW8381750.1 PmoA family protein [Verrucomicrobiota bacterium]